MGGWAQELCTHITPFKGTRCSPGPLITKKCSKSPSIFQIRVGRRGCLGLKEDKENKMQISQQFILMTNTYHNRFVWELACDVQLVNPPHLCQLSSSSASGDAASPSCASCSWQSGNPGIVSAGKDLWGHPVQQHHGHHEPCPQVPHPHLPNTSRAGDPTTAQSRLLQCLTAPSGRKFSLKPNPNFPWCTLRLEALPCSAEGLWLSPSHV